MLMIYQRVKHFLLCSVVLVTTSVSAQRNDSIAALKHVFNTLQQNYATAKPLSYTIRYTYAAEGNPGTTLDSETANIKVMGATYYCTVSNTEILSTDSVTVVLFKDEKIMYLSKARQNTQMYHPLAMIDSLISNGSISRCSIDSSKGETNVVIGFAPQTGYRQITFAINEQTGYLNSIQYIVRTETLSDNPNNTNTQGMADEYSLVNAVFNNYTAGDSSVIGLNTGQYYLKDGKNFKTTEKYKDYQLYVGSSGL